ncbi:hypothetical protein [Bacillus sp. AFS040349]|uniref:hypothetical protein n=1 Tax=Bacillus sp. AFS040349 TaxID=2033502 RepID=UPI000BFCF285|nr:hypothetical protein [Bacillus sp. AFS040349]PGT83242.1 hypothetical protein COD11_12975 [Bacillus sp. AFS040349]
MLKEKIEDLFKPFYMKEKLFNMLKKNGQFIRQDSTLGYLYSLSIGVSSGKEIKVEVALQPGKQISILNAAVCELQITA